MSNFNIFKKSQTNFVLDNEFSLKEENSVGVTKQGTKGKISLSPTSESQSPSSNKSRIIKPTATYTGYSYPFIEDENRIIDQNSIFKDIYDATIQYQFPEIEITPLNNAQIFYYEEVVNENGENSGFLGKVTLSYNIINKLNDAIVYIPIALREVVLNLKFTDNVTREINTININGIVDEQKKEILFDIKDSAVKIAFSNLITTFNQYKCSIDLNFNFFGYSKVLGNSFDPDPILDPNPTGIGYVGIGTAPIGIEPIRSPYEQTMRTIDGGFNQRLPVDEEAPIDSFGGTGQRYPPKPAEESIKLNSYILKINKIINYPLPALKDKEKSLYRTTNNVGFVNNPFNSNLDYSLYEQIFISSISLDKLSIYKSKVTANEFLLIAKRYYIARTFDTKVACINTKLHRAIDNDTSKISFQFAIGPDLSLFDLNKIKIELFNNNLIDGDTDEYFDKIKFVYPNDIDAKYEINGNHYFQKAEVKVEGKFFLVDFTTENLNDASILINSIYNNLSQFANINFIHKEIKDTSIIEFNIQKTIGEVVAIQIENNSKKIKLKNNSLSSCKVATALIIDNSNAPLFSSSPFANFNIETDQNKEIQFGELNENLVNKNIKKVFLEYDIHEDIRKEFSNFSASTDDFDKYIQIQIKSQKKLVNRIKIELKISATKAEFVLERLKADFKYPLFMKFIVNNIVLPGATIPVDTIIYYTAFYYDKDNNLITNFSSVFDYANTSILKIEKK